MARTKRQLLLFVVPLLLASGSVYAQTSHGTIVAYTYSRDKFSIAADSETTPSDKPSAVRYDECKIIPLDGGTIFAAAGFMDYKPIGSKDTATAWSTFEVARLAASKVSGGDISAIADAWGSQMKSRLEKMKANHPSLIAVFQNGVIGNGIFATAKGGSITVATRNLNLQGGAIQIESVDCPADALCAAGELEVFKELIGDHPKVLTKNAQSWPPPKDVDQTTLATRIAELTETYDASGFVGGSIDVLELWRDGSIHWIARKPTCAVP